MRRHLLAFLLLPSALVAQISISPSSPSYTQNFNLGWTTSETFETGVWADNETLPGWYIFRNATGMPAEYRTQATLNGSATGPIYFLSHNSIPEDFVLGARVGDTDGSAPSVSGAGYYFAVRLVNDSPAVINEVEFSFLALQWYRSTGTNANVLLPSYQIVPAGGLADIRAGTWTDLPDLAYTAVQAGGTASVINFHTSSGAQQTMEASLTDLNWQPGTELYFRWYLNNVGGVDQGLGIDNVQVTATVIPEPSTVGLLAVGAVAFGAVALRRRRRA